MDPALIVPPAVYQNNGPRLLVALMVPLGLAMISTGLRFCIRLHRRNKIMLDDWLILASMVPILGVVGCSFAGVVTAGIGKKFETNMIEDPTRLYRATLPQFAVQPFLVTNITLVKFSILALYYRIFPTCFMKWGYIVLGTITGMWAISTLFATIFQCIPVQKAWNQTVEGHCVDVLTLYITTAGVINLATDIAILCLPMYEVYNLKAPTSQKIAITGTFLLGLMVIVADVLKLKTFLDLYIAYRAGLRIPFVFTDYMATLMMWINIEHSLSIICANLPTLRPILTTLLRWGSKDGKKHGKGKKRKPKGVDSTIGGSSETSEEPTPKRRVGGAKTGFTTLLQDTVDSEKGMVTIDQHADAEENDDRSNGDVDKDIEAHHHEEKITQGQSALSPHPREELRDDCMRGSSHVSLGNSAPEVISPGRTRSLPGLVGGRLSTGSGGGGVGQAGALVVPAITVTRDTQVAWDGGA